MRMLPSRHHTLLGAPPPGLYDVLTAREAEQGLKPEDPHLERLMALARGPHAEHVFVEVGCGAQGGVCGIWRLVCRHG